MAVAFNVHHGRLTFQCLDACRGGSKHPDLGETQHEGLQRRLARYDPQNLGCGCALRRRSWAPMASQPTLWVARGVLVTMDVVALWFRSKSRKHLATGPTRRAAKGPLSVLGRSVPHRTSSTQAGSPGDSCDFFVRAEVAPRDLWHVLSRRPWGVYGAKKPRSWLQVAPKPTPKDCKKATKPKLILLICGVEASQGGTKQQGHEETQHGGP